MEEKYGPIKFYRVNKAGLILLGILAAVIIVIAIFDVLYFAYGQPLPVIFEIQYQVLYVLWVLLIFVCLGIERVTIDDKSADVSLFFAKNKHLTKEELATVSTYNNRLYLIPIVAVVRLGGTTDISKLIKDADVISLPAKYKERLIERGYEVDGVIKGSE